MSDDDYYVSCLLVEVPLGRPPYRRHIQLKATTTLEQLLAGTEEVLNEGAVEYAFKALSVKLDRSRTPSNAEIIWNETFENSLVSLMNKSTTLASLAKKNAFGEEDWEKYCLLVVTYSKTSKHGLNPIVYLSPAQKVSRLIQVLATPSTDATPKRLAVLQTTDHHGVICSGRPMPLQPLPLSVLHPVFGEFVQRVSLLPDSSTFNARDLVAARLFIESSLEYYDIEQDRRKTVEPYLGYFLPDHNPEITFPHPDRRTTFKSDSPKLVYTFSKKAGAQAVRMMPSNIEWRVECECDPIDRSAKAYTLFCLGSEMQELRELTSLPSFIIGIAGPFIQVAGAIFVDGVPVCTPLTDLISLVNPHQRGKLPEGCPSHQEHLIWKIAHLLRSLNDCLTQLDEFYLTPPPTHPLHPHPSFTKFTYNNMQYELIYTSRFDSDLATGPRAIFKATALQARAGRDPLSVVIKFTSTYNAKAHRVLDELNIAAKLYFCEWVPALAQYVVVMEELKDHTLDIGLSAEGHDMLHKGLQHLHNNGMVFGDLRAPNVLVQANGLPKLVDFDWSGPVGKARYPTNIMKVQFREGAAGTLITKEDDMDMLGKYYSLFQ